jgi:hypothetical protein
MPRPRRARHEATRDFLIGGKSWFRQIRAGDRPEGLTAAAVREHTATGALRQIEELRHGTADDLQGCAGRDLS